MPTLRPLLCALLIALAPAAQAARVTDIEAVPFLDTNGKAGYREFLATLPPRAFAIAPGGAWGYSVEAGSSELAEQEALANCQANTRQRCLVYARDGTVVLTPAESARTLGPYQPAAVAARAPVGTLPGQHFPDLVFHDANGRRQQLSGLRGQAVVLHFWGSWCPPCQREMPDLARLVASAKASKGIRFVFLQVREDFATASTWASRIAKGLPLYDSGMKGGRDSEFRLAGGGRLADRAIAMAFPTTYVIDRHGIVVFAHTGPVSNWPQYLPLLRDVATRSGK